MQRSERALVLPTVGPNWQEKTEIFSENSVPVPLCPPQIQQKNILGRNPSPCGEKLATNLLDSTVSIIPIFHSTKEPFDSSFPCS